MRRARSDAARFARVLLATGVLALAGCGREKPQQELSFEKLPDTTGLSAGPALVERFEPYRMPNGAVRVSGQVRLPDSTRLQIAIKRPGGVVSVAMAQVTVIGQRFDTPPLLGETGPLPRGDYRFEVLAHFNADWQPARVLSETAGGRGLRGPGMTRARNGDPALFLARMGRL